MEETTLKPITLKEAAGPLKRSPTTLREWCFREIIPSRYTSKEGRDWHLVLAPEVYEIAAKRRRGPRPKERPTRQTKKRSKSHG